MSAQANQQLIRKYFQNVSADFFAEDAQLHDTSQPRPLKGRESIRAFLRIFLDEAFPDGAYELHSVIADERCGMAEWTFRGTNTGAVMDSPATGRSVEFSGVSVYEIEDGRFRRARIYYDTGNLAEQLGFTGGRIPQTERGRWTEWWEREQRS